MLQSILNTMGQTLIPAILTACAGFITWGAHTLLQKLSKKADKQSLQASIDILDGFVTASVNSVEQTIVDTLKAKGQWGDPASYQQALNAALTNAKAMAIAATPQLVAQFGLELNNILTSLIQAKIKEIENKKAASIVLPIPAIQPKA